MFNASIQLPVKGEPIALILEKRRGARPGKYQASKRTS